MHLTFHGAARTVTGSQHLLEVNGRRILLDCGLFQGRRADTYNINYSLPFDPTRLDAVILSHAHIDHSGNLPNLLRHGYRGPIYTTPASADLADVMLRDAGHIQEADVEFLNKKCRKRGEPLLDPLYTLEDAAKVAGQFERVNYDESFHPAPGVTARLVDAGHLLGSAAIVLDVEEPGRPAFRLWFSGDVGRQKLPLLRDPVLPADADYLIMECTYGDRLHGEPQEAYAEFRDVVRKAYQRGGKVIVPAFAVGRTQELVFSLHEMTNRGEIPRLPVYVDSPLAVEASTVFRRHPECFDEETRRFVAEDRHPALNYDLLTYVSSVEESKKLNDRHDPMVIISASGMAETGRILHHLRNNIEDARNIIAIVSWQAPYTLGRRLAEGERRVRIFGEEFVRRAEVVTINGYSAHADQAGLLRYALTSKDTIKKIFLVHGEQAAAEALMDKLREAGAPPAEYPALHAGVDL